MALNFLLTHKYLFLKKICAHGVDVIKSFIFALSFVAETFDPKKFFEMVGMKAMSAENVKKVFQVLDVDGSGFIEEEELM